MAIKYPNISQTKEESFKFTFEDINTSSCSQVLWQAARSIKTEAA